MDIKVEKFDNVFLCYSKRIDKQTAIWLGYIGGLGIQKENLFLTGDLKVVGVTLGSYKGHGSKIWIAQKGVGKDGIIQLTTPTYMDVWLWLRGKGIDNFIPKGNDAQTEIIEHIHELRDKYLADNKELINKLS